MGWNPIKSVTNFVSNPIKEIKHSDILPTVGYVYGGIPGLITGAISRNVLGGSMNGKNPGSSVDPNSRAPGDFSTPGVGLPQIPNQPITIAPTPKLSPFSQSAEYQNFSGNLQGINDKLKQQFRDNALQTARIQSQDSSDALARRFASMGGLNSGSFIKLDQQQRDKAYNDANNQANQQANQLDNQLQEQLATTGLNADLQDRASQFQADTARNTAQANMDFQNKVFNFESGSKLKDLDLAERQFQLDAASTDFNKRLASMEANKPDKGLFGQGGFLGTGLKF